MGSSDDGSHETSRIGEEGRVTIPARLREACGLDAGTELEWERVDDGLKLTTTERSAGRGLLVDDDVSTSQRERMAEALTATIRERRATAWDPP